MTGTYKGSLNRGRTQRSKGQDRKHTKSLYRGEMDFIIAGRVAEVADGLGHSPAQIAIAWLLTKPEVTAPIVGVSKTSQLKQLILATKILLPEEEIAYLEQPYRPFKNLLSIGPS